MSQFEVDTGVVLDDRSTDDLVHTITTTVAEAEDVETWDLAPLYDAIDPEALCSLVASHDRLDEGHSLEVTFDYHGYEVTVSGDGTVDLSP